MYQNRPAHYRTVINPIRKELRGLRADGWTVADLARAFDMPPETVRYHVQDISGRKGIKGNPKITREHALELLARGWRKSQIADSFGLSRPRVTRITAPGGC